MIVGDSLDTQARDCSNTGDVFFAGNSVTVYMILSAFSQVFPLFSSLFIVFPCFWALFAHFWFTSSHFRFTSGHFGFTSGHFRFTSGSLPVCFRSTSGVTSYPLPV